MPTPPYRHGYALLVAVDQSEVAGAALPDIAKDIAALHAVLVHPERCGYADDHVKVIVGPDSTRAGIMAGLGWLRDRLQADGDATALIYYTGHGHVDAAGGHYLIPYDVNLNQLKTSALRAEDLAAVISALQPTRLLVVLDCCHAAGMALKELTPGAIHSAALPPALFMPGELGCAGKGLETLAQGRGRAVLSSCRADESSWLRKDSKMSLFTYHLIEALTGHAQPLAGATEVLVSDIMGHVTRRVPASALADWNQPQHPDYLVSGNFPVALLLGGKGLDQGQSAPDPMGLPQPVGVNYQATVNGNGAINQGSGTAVGAGGVFVGGKNNGDINTGTRIDTGGGAYIGGGVNTHGGAFVGRDWISQGIAPGELEPLFAALLATVARQAPADQQASATQQVQALKAEVAQGKQADDGKLARIVDGLVDLVPGAVGALVGMFATPVLQGIVGPVTKYVLNKLKGD